MKKIILLTLITSFLLGACSFLDTQAELEIEEEELNFLITEAGTVSLPLTKFNTLNPFINDNEYYFYFSKLIFEALFDFDDDLQPAPQLVEDYRFEDATKLIIKLRDDVLWHDGEKFTSTDVKFTIDALSNRQNTIYSSLSDSYIDLNYIASAKIIDQYNMEINFKRESPNMLGLLSFPIVPHHHFNSPREVLDEEFIPIGTGPFKYESSNRMKDINLLANDYYRFGKPRIDKVEGRVLDDELFISSFEAGQLDITLSSQLDLDKYIQNKSANVTEFISSDYEFLGFNFENEILSGEKAQAIRKAISYGINIEDIVENIYYGHVSQVDLPIHPQANFLTRGIDSHTYSPDLAKSYLKRAGFEDKEGNGILEDEEGNILSFSYLTNPSNSNRRRIAELIKEDLSKIGIELILDYEIITNEEYSLEMKEAEWANLLTRLEESDFDIVQVGLSMSVIPDIGHLFHSEGSNNFINYRDETMDSLIANYESQDFPSEENNELQKYIAQELPYISLFYKNKALLVNNKILGQLNPTGHNPYKGLENCFTTRPGD